MRADLTKTMSNLGPGPRVKSRPTAVWGDFFIFCQHTSSETLFVSEFQKRLSRWSLQEMWKRDEDPKDKGGENGSAHPAVAGVKVQPNKTQCQLCKRLAYPAFLIPSLVLSWKEYHIRMWSLWGSQQPFSCVFVRFRPGDNQMNNRTNNWTNNWVILVQACSWLVRRKSFAIKRAA